MSEATLVLGASGLVGRAIVRALSAAGSMVIGSTRSDTDLRDPLATLELIRGVQPDAIVHAAGVVSGIEGNLNVGMQLGIENSRLVANVASAALEVGVSKLVYLGCACCYPNDIQREMTPNDLFGGPIEESSRAYALAKLVGLELVLQAWRSGLRWVALIPSNLYGPGDNFDRERSHVVPALIRRFHEAKEAGWDNVELRGSGGAVRQLLYIDDLAEAVVMICQEAISPPSLSVPILNAAAKHQYTIADVARLIADCVGYSGNVTWEAKQSDGTPVKLLDDSPLRSAGWEPRVDLQEGLSRTYRWVQSCREVGAVRGWL